MLILTGFLKKINWIDNHHNRIKLELKQKYNKSIDFKSIRFWKFPGFVIKEIEYYDVSKDFSITISALYCKFEMLKLLRRQTIFKEVIIEDGSMKMKRSGVRNDQKKTDNSAKTYYRRILSESSRLLYQIFAKMPGKVRLANFDIINELAPLKTVSVKDFMISGDSFDYTISNQRSKKYLHYKGKGRIEKRTDSGISISNAIFEVESEDKEILLEVKAAEIKCGIIYTKPNCYKFKCSLNLLVTNVGTEIFSLKQSGKVKLITDVTCIFEESGFYITKPSSICFNKLDFSFSTEFYFKRDPYLNIGLELSNCSLKDFFESVPTFQYMGNNASAYSGHIKFSSFLQIRDLPFPKTDFKIDFYKDLKVAEKKYLNLTYLEYPFKYLVYDEGKFVKEVFLNNGSSGFVDFENISPYLKMSIVASEDRDFYSHKGVDTNGIGLAIVTNIANRKFSRGGSTITMQLVRNLFLNHQKNVSRKIEELFITWIIEEIHSIPKKRILEIYLNIIEFGPGVYGIEEAADFYFSKKPAELTLSESLVLSYIVPRPKFFLPALKSKSDQLQRNLGIHMENISLYLLKKKFITTAEYEDINYEVEFSKNLGTLYLKNWKDSLHKVLLEKYLAAIIIWDEQYVDLPKPFIVCTHRSSKRQDELYSQGRDTEGDIVTNARGGQSPHNFIPSFAFDIAFKTELGVLGVEETHELFGKFAKILAKLDKNDQIVWGGDFKTFYDIPHFELKEWK